MQHTIGVSSSLLVRRGRDIRGIGGCAHQFGTLAKKSAHVAATAQARSHPANVLKILSQGASEPRTAPLVDHHSACATAPASLAAPDTHRRPPPAARVLYTRARR